MKIIINSLALAFLFSILSTYSYSQNVNHCGTDFLMNKKFEENPLLKIQKQQHDLLLQQISHHHPKANITYTIPVVFHVLHLDGPENISDVQVKDALRILNNDFSKLNADTSEIIQAFKPIASSVNINFKLAKLDPNGNCTNGIVHYYDADTDWNIDSPTLYQYTWDPTKYMNVYIVRSIDLGSGFGAAGYTYLPGSLGTGSAEDAIVVLNNYFGSVGTGSNFLSRVLTHEVGHWLDLWHVFGGSNSAGVDCSDDDYVNDTPTTPGYLSCPDVTDTASYQICTPGVSENFQNYMDYAYCCRMFTQGQALRMEQCVQSTISGRDNLWNGANLLATGVNNNNAPCTPIANFKYSRSKSCPNTPITFYDNSWNGKPTTYLWSFPGGTPSTSTDSMPVVNYATPGLYSVTYNCSNTNGSALPITKTNVVEIVNSTTTNPFSDGFESGNAVGLEWYLESSSGSANWETTTEAANSGNFSAKLNATNNTRKSVTSMTTKAINISLLNNPYLSFALATADLNTAHVNKLQVFYTKDCGITWNEIYNKVGTTLTTANITETPFVPLFQSEWRTEIVDISSFSDEQYVNFKFTYTRDTIAGACNVFIDDVNVQGNLSINDYSLEKNVSLYPNPTTGLVFANSLRNVIGYKISQVDGKVVHLGNTFPINLNGFTNGFYTIDILYNDSIIKQHKLILNK